MDEFDTIGEETAGLESAPAAAEEDKPGKSVDENWQRYVDSAWWWGWYT